MINPTRQSVFLTSIILICLNTPLFAQNFFAPSAPPKGLAKDKIFPRGQIFPFIGFSGKAQWQKDNGYTVYGPVYGDQSKQNKGLAEAKAVGLPFIYQIGLNMNFLEKDGKPAVQMKRKEIHAAIEKQALAVTNDSSICWWNLRPEELRNWKKAEMEYMETVKKALFNSDNGLRPVWMYEPNSRNTEALTLTGKHQDIIGKGFYVNLSGMKDDRVWVRWSAEQEVGALKKLNYKNGLALVMPELAADPDPGEEPMIPIWTRHDVYSGLINGCKGVAIWSLFKRPEVAKTHETWMSSYATVAKELTGPKALGQVFLFGEVRNSLDVSIKNGPEKIELKLGKARDQEGGDDISSKERRKLTKTYPSFSSRELAYGTSRYLFITNETPQELTIEVTGFPRSSEALSLFDDLVTDVSSGRITLKLGKWGASCMQFSQRGAVSTSAPVHQWKSVDGREIAAQFGGLKGGQLRLIRDGKEFTLPLSKLSLESQNLARKLAK